jgi:outer membrane protein assembly factor BamE (lipoprotein component of BamABCDE complex)
MRLHSGLLTLIVTLLVALGVAGCATPKYTFGTPPKTDALTTLRPGSSSRADVVKVLGQPPGKGVFRVLPDAKPRTIWSYEYNEVEGAKGRQKVLLVYFDGDVLDGYLWFSSVQMLEQTKN